MRIGLNLLFMVPGEVGGSETLLTGLLTEMMRTDNEFFVFAVRGFTSAYPDIAADTHVVEVPWDSGAQGLRIAAEHSWMNLQAKKLKLDVLHHGGGTAPLFTTVPCVTTIFDIQYLHFPSNFNAPKRAWLNFNVPRAARSSKLVCTCSDWVKDDICDRLDIPGERVKVTGFGSERLFLGSVPDGQSIREKYSLLNAFFLFPARTYAHKNHDAVVKAMADVGDDTDLVLTGAKWHRDGAVIELAERLGAKGRIRQLGTIPRTDLAALYAEAVCLVFPSRFEGFGAPVLEAMSIGCPVIASNVTAIPEVVGTAGILLDPGDVAAWSKSMNEMATNPALRNELIEKGRARASEFKWSDSAAVQLDAYEKAASL